MLELYHAASSVCSSKVRVGLAEKGIDWNGHSVNLAKGEQNDPNYLKLNPNGVVPTLIDGDLVVVESSVILEYIDDLEPNDRLMPDGKAAKARARIWLTRCIDIHAAINTMTFTTVNRDRVLASKTTEEIEASILRMSNPATAAKRRDVLGKGLDSTHVWSAFFILRRMFDDMQTALTDQEWLLGNHYSIADTALISYVDRLDRLGFSGLWEERTPTVSRWLSASKARPSYQAIEQFIDADDARRMQEEGSIFWPAVEQRWKTFLTP